MLCISCCIMCLQRFPPSQQPTNGLTRCLAGLAPASTALVCGYPIAHSATRRQTPLGDVASRLEHIRRFHAKPPCSHSTLTISMSRVGASGDVVVQVLRLRAPTCAHVLNFRRSNASSKAPRPSRLTPSIVFYRQPRRAEDDTCCAPCA